jgi:hypothetical protein
VLGNIRDTYLLVTFTTIGSGRTINFWASKANFIKNDVLEQLD